MSSALASLLAASALAVVTTASRPCFATDWRGYWAFEGQMQLPDGEIAPSLPKVAGGFQMNLGAGPQGLPLILGVNIGSTFLQSRTTPGPHIYVADDSSVTGEATSLNRSLTLQTGELVLRFEPEWYRVRPFLEVGGGLAVMRQSVELSGGGTTYDSLDTHKSTTTSFSYALGIDIEPWNRLHYSRGTVGLAFTAGLRSTYFGAFDDVQPLFDASNRATWQTTAGSLHTWTAFVGITLSVEKRPPPNEDDEPPHEER